MLETNEFSPASLQAESIIRPGSQAETAGNITCKASSLVIPTDFTAAAIESTMFKTSFCVKNSRFLLPVVPEVVKALMTFP